MKFGMGQSVRRTEDIRFITGQGRYTDDLRFDGELFVAFLRSPHGHAKITSIDTSAAKAAPGVVGVLTYEDIEAVGAAPMPLLAPIPSRDGSFAKSTAKPLLAKDKVTFAGEAIAMAVAETYAQACDAAELVAVEYEPIDAAGTLDSADRHRPANLGQCAEQSLFRLDHGRRSGRERSLRERPAHRKHRSRAEPHCRELDGDA